MYFLNKLIKKSESYGSMLAMFAVFLTIVHSMQKPSAPPFSDLVNQLRSMNKLECPYCHAPNALVPVHGGGAAGIYNNIAHFGRERRLYKCDNCGGTAKITETCYDDQNETIANDGLDTLAQYRDAYITADELLRSHACPECNGTGNEQKGNCYLTPCKVCRGTGCNKQFRWGDEEDNKSNESEDENVRAMKAGLLEAIETAKNAAGNINEKTHVEKEFWRRDSIQTLGVGIGTILAGSGLCTLFSNVRDIVDMELIKDFQPSPDVDVGKGGCLLVLGAIILAFLIFRHGRNELSLKGLGVVSLIGASICATIAFQNLSGQIYNNFSYGDMFSMSGPCAAWTASAVVLLLVTMFALASLNFQNAEWGKALWTMVGAGALLGGAALAADLVTQVGNLGNPSNKALVFKQIKENNTEVVTEKYDIYIAKYEINVETNVPEYKVYLDGEIQEITPMMDTETGMWKLGDLVQDINTTVLRKTTEVNGVESYDYFAQVSPDVDGFNPTYYASDGTVVEGYLDTSDFDYFINGNEVNVDFLTNGPTMETYALVGVLLTIGFVWFIWFILDRQGKFGPGGAFGDDGLYWWGTSICVIGSCVGSIMGGIHMREIMLESNGSIALGAIVLAGCCVFSLGCLVWALNMWFNWGLGKALCSHNVKQEV